MGVEGLKIICEAKHRAVLPKYSQQPGELRLRVSELPKRLLTRTTPNAALLRACTAAALRSNAFKKKKTLKAGRLPENGPSVSPHRVDGGI